MRTDGNGSLQNRGGLTLDSAAAYEIRVQGRLDESWSERLNGAAIQTESQADSALVTVLTGHFQDQAALVGVLNTVYDLGLPLLSVRRLGALP